MNLQCFFFFEVLNFNLFPLQIRKVRSASTASESVLEAVKRESGCLTTIAQSVKRFLLCQMFLTSKPPLQQRTSQHARSETQNPFTRAELRKACSVILIVGASKGCYNI